MGYNRDKMAALSKYSQNSYDSDKELPEDVQSKIRQDSNPDKVRDEAWSKAGVYPKIKRFMGDAWSGDIRKKK